MSFCSSQKSNFHLQFMRYLMLKGGRTSGKMACHNFKRKKSSKPDKWTNFSLLLLLRSSVKALARLLPSLAGVFSRSNPSLLAIHQNWFPQLPNRGIPAQKRAACTICKFSNSRREIVRLYQKWCASLYLRPR